MAEAESAATMARVAAKRRYLFYAKGFYTFHFAAFAFLGPYLALYYSDLGFSYEMSGPWPPFNFVALNFSGEVAHE